MTDRDSKSGHYKTAPEKHQETPENCPHCPCPGPISIEIEIGDGPPPSCDWKPEPTMTAPIPTNWQQPPFDCLWAFVAGSMLFIGLAAFLLGLAIGWHHLPEPPVARTVEYDAAIEARLSRIRERFDAEDDRLEQLGKEVKALEIHAQTAVDPAIEAQYKQAIAQYEDDRKTWLEMSRKWATIIDSSNREIEATIEAIKAGKSK